MKYIETGANNYVFLCVGSIAIQLLSRPTFSVHLCWLDLPSYKNPSQIHSVFVRFGTLNIAIALTTILSLAKRQRPWRKASSDARSSHRLCDDSWHNPKYDDLKDSSQFEGQKPWNLQKSSVIWTNVYRYVTNVYLTKRERGASIFVLIHVRCRCNMPKPRKPGWICAQVAGSQFHAQQCSPKASVLDVYNWCFGKGKVLLQISPVGVHIKFPNRKNHLAKSWFMIVPHDTWCRKKNLGYDTKYAIQRYNALDFDKGHEYVLILSSIASPSEICRDEVLCSEAGEQLGRSLLGISPYHIFCDFKKVENNWSKWIISRNRLEIWEEMEITEWQYPT